MGSDEATTWGRVDENGTVYVRYEDGERAVGEYPDATADEALAYFARKYADLEGQVKIAEQRVQRGASANDVSRTVAHLREQLANARVVGDIKSLEDSVQALNDQFAEGFRKELASLAQEIERSSLQSKEDSRMTGYVCCVVICRHRHRLTFWVSVVHDELARILRLMHAIGKASASDDEDTTLDL